MKTNFLYSAINDSMIDKLFAMRLAEESQARLERFFRSFEQDETLHLPPVFIHTGFLSHWLTKILRVAAITIGCHVFVSRDILQRDAGESIAISGGLLAHEVAHVRQFEQEGFLPFICNYVREYLTLVSRGGKLNSKARLEAYQQIGPEREARSVEAAYLEWREHQSQ
jgi:hypothetical protein